MDKEFKVLLQALADGKVLQRKHNGEWASITLIEALSNLHDVLLDIQSLAYLRVGPQTQIINGIKCPKYETIAPPKGAEYCWLDQRSLVGFSWDEWDELPSEHLMLERGQVYLKEEDIKQVVKAIGWVK